MNAKLQSRPDLLLLLSLLVAILLTPVLNQDNWRRLVLAAVTFIPIVLSIVRLSQIKRWVWPSVLLALGNAVFVVAGNTFPSPTLTGIRWAFLAAFFGLTATGLFSYLRNSRSVAQAELYTAVNIYLLLGLLWAAIYLAIDEPDNALYRRIRRYRAAQRNGPHTNGTGRGDRGSLHSEYGGGFGRQVQERILGVTALDREP